MPGFPIDSHNSRPEMVFNQIGVVSAKASVVKQTCAPLLPPPPEKNPAWNPVDDALPTQLKLLITSEYKHRHHGYWHTKLLLLVVRSNSAK